MKKQKRSKGKRGRPENARILERAPRMGADLTVNSANAFIEKALPAAAFQTYHFWLGRYEAARKCGHGEKVATGEANKATSTHFRCSENTVRRRIQALKSRHQQIQAWYESDLYPSVRQHNEALKRLREAQAILRDDDAYAHLREQMVINLQHLGAAEAARPDSPQTLASVLAAAFLRAHAARTAAEKRAETAERKLRQAETRLAGYKASYG